MKKTNKVKMGPLGTPLGNPLGYFNSLKGKTKTEPKQTLKKAQDGIETNGYGEDSNMLIDKPGYSGNYKKPVSPWTPPSSDRNGRVDEPSPNREELDLIIKERNKLMKEYFENGQGMGSYPPPGHISGPPRQEPPPFGPPPQSKGGSVKMQKGGSHRMPNGKMMLNSAMKKGGLVKKKK